ncbi:MAG: hypothetical protein JSW65_05080 [Candidatus Bipolaricaulota bacterium]|nr:MAG: hypothetical protein JSW65_05080 [Candidatus Bipolaricaulota bacterium]
MTKRRVAVYKAVFLAAAVYDIVLGIVFTFFYRVPFRWLGIDLPYSNAFVTLLGSFLLVIGIAYLLIVLGDLRRNRDLILIGALYKAAYSAIAFFHLTVGDIPHILFALIFGIIDIVFLVVFTECLVHLRRTTKSP